MRTRQTVLILTLVFLTGVFTAQLPAKLAHLSGSTTRYEFFQPLIDVFSVIDAQYVEEADKLKLQLGAINGMLDALGDPYTQFVPPADRAAFQKELTGQFVGIGAEVVIDGGYLTIVSPLEDSPAFAAGIQPGDKVLEIDGKSTLNLSVDNCIALLTGTPGTPVDLLVERRADGAPAPEQVKITVVRDRIVVRAVKGVTRQPGTGNGRSNGRHNGEGYWDYMLDPERRIAYIRLTQFTPTAAEEFRRGLRELNAEQAGAVHALILDLRGNPGGVLDAALEIADLFLPRGAIVSIRGRGGKADAVHSARSAGTLPDFPVIVLVNGASASASEIVAGSLADHDRAVVLGTRTFGKGLVQAVQPMKSPVWGGALGAQIKFTSQRYFLPSGRMIHRTDEATVWGVDPTPGFYVQMSSAEQIARQLARRDRDILRAVSETGGDREPDRWSDPEWIRETMKDPQLAEAVRAVHIRLADGQWQPIADIADSTAQATEIELAELRQLERGRERVHRELLRLERRIEALTSAAAGDMVLPRDFDLWPDETPIAGGRLEVYDKDGKHVRTLTIIEPTIERWLMDAGVEPVTVDEE